MNPAKRRLVQALAYEGGAILFVGPAIAVVFRQPLQSTLALAVVMSTIAVAWNFAFNWYFERWESRQAIKGRSLKRRLVHGAGFEGGLIVFLVPLMAVWLDTTLLNAFLADLGMLVFFYFYTVGFTWAFDKVFGLPESAVVEEA